MSLSYRRSAGLRLAVSRACVIAAVAALPPGTSFAAQTYVQPQFDLRAESSDNFNLIPGGSPDSDVYGYIADLQALIGIATPRSNTSIRPRVRLQEYPDRDDMERLEAFLDVRSQYKWERSEFLVLGKYSRQDSYNADQPSGEFDPLDPNDPADPNAGNNQVGQTRNLFLIRPNYTFALTERTRLGVEADYQAVRYDADSGQATQTDYDFMIGQGFVSWSIDPRSDFSIGAYVSKYEATDDSSDADAYGGEIGYQYRWSETIGAEVSIVYEQDDTTDYVPVTVKDSTSGWGGTVTGYRQGEVSSWRVTAGRTFIPTGDGGKANSDQFRVQYDRDLSERLSFRGAARYEARTELGGNTGDNDRDYARADLTLKWMMAPTWYLQGGYSYVWEDRASAPGDAANNKLFVSFGYQGLARPR